MSYYKDLREYLEVLKKAGKLRAVTTPVNKDTELHPLVRWQYRGLPEEKRFGFLFENVVNRKGTRYAGRTASSVIAPNREVYALALNCPKEEIQQRWIKALENPTPTKLLSHGPCKEEIHKGGGLLEHRGLDEFPIPVATNGFEAFPRMTAGTWISRDPDTGAYNTGLYNGIVLAPDRVACRVVSPGQGGLIHWRKWRQRGQATPVALVIGGPPVMPIVAATRVPHDTSELEVAGTLMGEPLEVVRCETLDINVPATAEIVVEGEWLPDYLEHDGPSGENWGHTVLGNFVPSFRVKCITHRKNPIWVDIICQIPPSESSTVRGIGSEGRILSLLRSHGIPQVRDVALHHCGGGARFCVLQFHDVGGYRTPNNVVWQALFATLSVSPGWPKIAIAVDEEIDARSLESVFWAVCGRIQPHRDVRIIQGRNPSLDQSAAPRVVEKKEEDFLYGVSGSQSASAMLIDATRKWEYTPISLPKRPYMERAKQLWEELDLPSLQPISPWHGVSLGLWPEEVSRLVELFEQGRGDEAAEELMKKGKRI